MVNKKQFVYVLTLIPRLYEDSNWTPYDEEIIHRHYMRLQNNTAVGKVILAGRTLNSATERFGLVIFEAESDEEALEFMKGDPAVMEGIMTAELYPYRIAVMRSGG